METNETPLYEIAKLLMPLVAQRLPRNAAKRLARESNTAERRRAIGCLDAWLSATVPRSVLDDVTLDFLELLYYCLDILKQLSRENLSAILGLADSLGSAERITPGSQILLQLSTIEVPSHSVYHYVRTAVATKAFNRVDGTLFPTAPVNAKDARGQAQLRPLVLDTVATIEPADEERLAMLMWEQREELSDLDSDIWDYCNWKWLEDAQSPESYVTVTVSELLTMRGIMKKLNGKGQRGGYKRSQKLAVLKSLDHLRNVWLELVEFELYSRRRGRFGGSISEAIHDRAIRIRESGQFDLIGELQVQSIAYRPGHLFARFLFGPGRQVALLSTRALKYSLQTEVYEKRLARYLSWQWRIRASDLEYLQPYRVLTLLHAIDLKVDRRRAAHTRKRLELALERLQDDMVIRAWQYKADLAPETRPGWMDQWAVSTILVEPPQIVLERYQKIGLRRGELVDIADFSERLKDKRLQYNLSILRAAEQSGVAPRDYLCAEQGRQPSASAFDKLTKWLAG